MPDQTFATLAALAIPLAVVAAAVRQRAYSAQGIAAAIVAAAIGGAVLGIAQRGGQAPHLFPFTSSGPTGQFANTNHLAALAGAAIPFIAAIGGGAWASRGKAPAAIRPLLLLAALLLAITIFATGALAVILLLVPVGVASWAIARGWRGLDRRWLLPSLLAVAVLGGGVALVDRDLLSSSSVSVSSRQQIWSHSLESASMAVAGSGFGSFETIYGLGEDPLRVDRFYVNHAHNDAIELAIEGGVPAMLLLALLLAWWAGRTIAAWRPRADADPYARAGSVAAGLLMAHSLVEFPLRTAALAAVFAASLALLALASPPSPAGDPRDLRPTRHKRIA